MLSDRTLLQGWLSFPQFQHSAKARKKSDVRSFFLNTQSRIPASALLAAKALKIPEDVWVTALALLSHSTPYGIDPRTISEDTADSYGRSSRSV